MVLMALALFGFCLRYDGSRRHLATRRSCFGPRACMCVGQCKYWSWRVLGFFHDCHLHSSGSHTDVLPSIGMNYLILTLVSSLRGTLSFEEGIIEEKRIGKRCRGIEMFSGSI